MFTATKIESTIRPEKFESLNNGIWYYNYDIVEKMVITRDMNNEEEIEQLRYEFVQVRIEGTPTFSKCYEAILKAFKNEEGTSLYDRWTLSTHEESQYAEIKYLIRVDLGLEEEDTPLKREKRRVLHEIEAYDSSDSVNSFLLNGMNVWLNKDTRVGLMNSLTIESNAGKEQSTLWFNNICITINCDAAIQMLSALELYALSCYNVTAEHKVTVEGLTDVEDVKNYDYTVGYPNKLNFTV